MDKPSTPQQQDEQVAQRVQALANEVARRQGKPEPYPDDPGLVGTAAQQQEAERARRQAAADKWLAGMDQANADLKAAEAANWQAYLTAQREAGAIYERRVIALGAELDQAMVSDA